MKIIHGTEDQVVGIENSRKICEALSRCEFEKVEGIINSKFEYLWLLTPCQSIV